MDSSQSGASAEALLKQGVMWSPDYDPLVSSPPMPSNFRRSHATTTTTTSSANAADDFEFVEQDQDTGLTPQQKHVDDDYGVDDDSEQSEAVTASTKKQQQPMTLRVLFMGNSLSDRHKTSVLKKFAEAIASMASRRHHPHYFSNTTALYSENDDKVDGSSSSSSDEINNNNNTMMVLTKFQERKHHIVFLDAFDSEPIETYEDNGLNVIEADFTWSPEEATTGSSSFLHLQQQQQQQQRKRQLREYIDHYGPKIDLVIYFYSSHSVAMQQHQLVDQEMQYLKRISCSVPTWPILVHRPHEQRAASAVSSHRGGNSRNTMSRPSTANTYRTASPRSPTPAAAAAATSSSGGGRTSSSTRSRTHTDSNDLLMVAAAATADEVDPISLRQSFSEQLIRHGVKCVDLPGINPERPKFLGSSKNNNGSSSSNTNDKDNTIQEQQLDIMTVDQFITIDKKELARMLKRWRKAAKQTTTAIAYRDDGQQRRDKRRQQGRGTWIKDIETRKLSVIGAQMLLLLAVLVGGLLYDWGLHTNEGGGTNSNKENIMGKDSVELHPMWNLVNQETLRHMFMVQVPLAFLMEQQQPQQNFSVILDQYDQLREYPMEYQYYDDKAQIYYYAVDVPSPCLLNSDHDFIASVLWYRQRQEPQEEDYQEDEAEEQQQQPLLIDRVELTIEACDPVSVIKHAADQARWMCRLEDGVGLSTVLQYPKNAEGAWRMYIISLKLQMHAMWLALTSLAETLGLY